MKLLIKNLASSAIFGFLVVLPFIVLELVNARPIGVSFPFALFGVMWILASIVLSLAIPLVRDLRAGKSVAATPVNLILRVSVVVLVAVVWTGIVNDQMPCFMGVPNCD